LFKGFLRQVVFAGEEAEGIGGKLPKYVKKALISKQTLGHFKNWI